MKITVRKKLGNQLISLMGIVLLSMLVFVSCTPKKSGKENNENFYAKNYRYVICTDMTHDDDNSLIRLLHYANEVDIEAIIVTDQGPETNQIENWPEQMWNRAQSIFDAYQKVVDNLRLHDPGFPDADYFRKITKLGKGTAQRMTGSSDNGQEKFWDYVGEGRDSEASDYLQEVFDRDDDRPIFVGFWGGSITFAQAMWRYQQNHTPEEVQALLDKMIFHSIILQDVTFDLFLDLDSIGTNIGTRKPFYGDYNGERLIPGMHLADADNFWGYIGAIDVEKVHEYSGPLGDLYDEGGEGDTPSFLNLLSMNLGLSDIDKPEYGGWGDMFHPYSLENVWVTDHNNPEGLMQWLPQTTNSFYARCMWQENDYESCNHDPVAAFKGDTSSDFIYLKAKPGEKIKLSSKGSSDPDGDELSYKWWHYDSADSFTENVDIKNASQLEARLTVPEMEDNQELHIILEVQDNGFPQLVSYKRIIISNL